MHQNPIHDPDFDKEIFLLLIYLRLQDSIKKKYIDYIQYPHEETNSLWREIIVLILILRYLSD